MNLAGYFVESWHNQAKTISAANLAKRIDREVSIIRRSDSSFTTYDFADGSIAHTEGRGISFKIWCYSKENA